MHIKSFVPQVLAGLLIFVASLFAQNPDSVSDLSSTTWQLVKFQGGDDKTAVPDDKTKYTLTFDKDGQLSARLDCNRGRGTWKSEARNQLTFGPLALTRAMCPPGSLVGHLSKHLPNVRSYTLKDGHLFLALMADGGTYEFEPQTTNSASETKSAETEHSQPAAASSPPLENTYWKLIELNKNPITPVDQQREAHLVLNSETHRVAGSGGCNRVMGAYKVEGDTLNFEQMAGTMMACAEGMDTEKAFLTALSQVKHWKIRDQQLEMADEQGLVIARFQSAEMK
jgi:heat shock protein HslJ